MQISTIVIANPSHFQRNILDEFASIVITCSFNITWLSPLDLNIYMMNCEQSLKSNTSIPGSNQLLKHTNLYHKILWQLPQN